MYVLCLNFEVSVSEVCFNEKYCYKWEYYNYEFFNSKNCHLPDLYVPTEMLVYKVNNKVVASGYEQRGWSMIHGCPIPTGHVCMMVTSVQGDHVPPCILGDPSENGKLFNGGFFAFPVEALSLVTMNPDGSVRVRPYNS